MIKNWVFLLVLFVCFNLGAQQFTFTYSLGNVTPTSGTKDPSPLPVANGLVFDPLEAIGVSPNSSASGRFSFSGWPLGAIDANDTYSVFTGALSGTSYYECKIHVVPGSTLTLQSFEFSMRRSTTGVRNFSVRCDKNNFSSDLAASTGTNSKLMVLPVNLFFWKYDSVSTTSDQKGISISPAIFGKGITDSITFRIYGWNAESNNGSFSIDNLSFSGHVADSALLAGAEGISDGQSVMFYPNPCVSDRIFFSEPLSPGVIHDVTGVFVRKWNSPENSVDLSGLPNGVYYLQFGSNRRKLVIARVD